MVPIRFAIGTGYREREQQVGLLPDHYQALRRQASVFRLRASRYAGHRNACPAYPGLSEDEERAGGPAHRDGDDQVGTPGRGQLHVVRRTGDPVVLVGDCEIIANHGEQIVAPEVLCDRHFLARRRGQRGDLRTIDRALTRPLSDKY